MANWATLIYGIVSLVGGVIGYLKAGSKVSLISGSISGILILICSYLINQGADWALFVAAGITFVLIVVFSFRLRKTGKFMPAGLMVILGVATLVLIIYSILQI